MTARQVLSAYYWLAKPGIIYGNVMTAAAGFVLAARGQMEWGLFVAALAGLALVIGSACAFNNVIDRDIDAKMDRTKWRALVKGTVSARSALVYAAALGVAGFGLLAWRTNALTVALAAIGFGDYVVLYGWSKRRSPSGTLVGSVSGAMPIVVGYCAVSGRFDLGAALLFAAMVAWQMPHFYAIAMYRRADYAAAHIPVLPIVAGARATKLQMVAYIAAFTVAASLLSVYGYTGLTYRVVMLVLGGWWLWRAAQGFGAKDDVLWARGLFRFSLLVLLGFSAMVAMGWWLP